jgi:hypothetical protein
MSGGGGGRHENGHGGAAAAGGSGGSSDAHEDDLVMPGFRFHPTEEELIEFYLRRKVEGKRFNVELITFLDLYRYDPWELPGPCPSPALVFVVPSPHAARTPVTRIFVPPYPSNLSAPRPRPRTNQSCARIRSNQAD